MNKRFYLTLASILMFALCLPMLGKAQLVSNYGFTQSSGTYTPLVGGTVIAKSSSSLSQDDVTYGVTLPFTFNYNGTANTNIFVNTNGWLAFTNTSPGNTYTAISNTSVANGFVGAFSRDLDGRPKTTGNIVSGNDTMFNPANTNAITIGDTVSASGIPTNTTVLGFGANYVKLSAAATSTATAVVATFYGANISTTVLGTAPNRVFVIQWQRWSVYNSTGNPLNFQIRLDEGGGVAGAQTVSIVYGPTVLLSAGTAQVGLRGATNADYNNRTSTTSWTTTIAGSANNATVAYGPSIVPPTGLTFTYTPPAACTGAPATGTLAASVSSACASTPFTLSISGNPALSGITYQVQSRLGGTLTPFTDIAGATAIPYTISNQTTATDYRVVVTCTNSSMSTNSNVVNIGQNLFSGCYCIPTGGNCVNEWIDGVIFGSLSNLTTGCTVGGYANYRGNASLTTSVNQGGTYSITLNDHINAASSQIGVWIDFNQNGVFDASEFTLIGTGPATGFANLNQTFTGAITIPANALTGVTGMRVMARNGAILGTNACLAGLFGEVEDYLITIAPSVACAGTPALATATATTSAACASNSFSLSATGLPTSTGITYQWQSKPAGIGTFTNISGATTVPYTIVSQTAATDYRLVVTCTNSSLSSNSSTVTVTQNPFTACYCIPGTTSSTYYIDNFTTTGATVNLSNTASGYSIGGYGNFTGQTLTVSPLSTVSFSTVTMNSSATFGFAVFIDYNQNGSFADGGEVVFNTTSYTSNPSGSFTIPVSAMGGNTRMRIVANYLNSNPSAQYCTGVSSGEYEDYTINIVPLTTCSGTPNAGTAFANTVNACANTPFTLNDSLYSIGTGISYQWQSRPGGTATAFANITGATTIPYTITNQIAATDYRLVVTCSTSSLSSNSAIIVVGQNAATACYCVPATTSTSYYINNFATTGGLNNLSNLGTGYSTGGYGNFTAQTLSTNKLSTINFTTALVGGTFGFAVFIDYNQNGSFADAGELVFNTSGYATNPSGSFTIPASASNGTTRMRIVADYFNGNPSANYCSGTTNGEYEDYTINIIPLSTCSGVPNAGVAYTTVTSVCPTIAFNLLDSTYTFGSGISYQWQSAPSPTATFTDIAGATTIPFTIASQTATTSYRLKVRCSAGPDSSVSNVFTVTSVTGAACACIPTYTSGCTSSDDINDFILTGANGTSINDIGTGCSAGAFDNRTAQTPFVQLGRGTTYNGFISSNYSSSEKAKIWIDFNDNGIFEALDSMTFITLSGTTQNGYSINIPSAAPLGNHRMRVRLAYNPGNDIDPCNSYSFGETHDYTVTIVPCGNPVVNLGADTTLCSGSSITLNAGNPGNTYEFTRNGIIVGSAQTFVANTAGTYIAKVTVPGGCIGRDTVVIATAPAPVVNLGNDTTICSGSSVTFNAGNAGATYLWNTNATTQTITASTAGTYSVRVTSAGGCVGRDTVVLSISAAPVVNLGADTSICSGSSIVFNAGNAGSTYLWNTNATTQTITASTPGTYSVRVTNAAGCVGRDTVVLTLSTPPVVNLGADTAICAGSSIVFNAGNAGATYLWSTNATTQTITATTAGSYSVRVTNAQGCVGRDTVVLSISASPIVNLGTDTAICAGSSIVFNAGNAGATYLWSTSATTQTITASTAGSYSVRVTNALGCVGRDTVVLSISARPVVNLGPDTTVCAGTSVVFNAGNTGATYLWSTNATTQSITATTAGSYSVRVTNAQGCVGRDTVVLNVNARPVVNLGPDTSICSGSSIVFNAGNTGATYLWSTSATTQSITASTAGSYSVRVMNALGCEGRDTVVLTLKPTPVVNLGADRGICSGATTTLDAGNAGATFVWSTAATTQTITVSTAGTYSVAVTNGQGCTGRDTIVIAVNPPPVVNLGADTTICANQFLNLDAGNPGASYFWSTGDTTRTINITTAGTYSVSVSTGIGCSGSDTLILSTIALPDAGVIFASGGSPTYTFNAVGATGFTSSLWYFGDGDTSSASNPVHTYTANGTYQVLYGVGNSCGVDTATFTIVVSGVGINGATAQIALKLYPNPASNQVVIETEANNNIVEIQVLSATGAIVKTTKPDATRAVINTSSFASGIYTVRITTEKGFVIRRLQIQD